MKPLNLSIAAMLFAISSLALAEGGGDRTFARAMEQNEKAMERYAAKQGKAAPVVQSYRYGMKLDIAKVVSITPPIKSCEVVPSRMTYEDSTGQLMTIEYQIMGQCRNNGS
ncbi:DUF2790 domain-containing protein [Pseudomonas sessilinigenes]|uniref:DUF2790 domain-containing protein n=1 Tax=Pseudomonas sessilinigenes TaxID=658629 RepID=A0ABX8MN53_9PSED|nr:DUF2790 domain-containing protein [Pseudomonas sessilinigenes]AZC26085.1 hypothetical protein C4K39_4436 [Pseudomonas sessilinigenes]QXH39885.1 DUF2790 domain-containing protein [Pseudomonas sessilinigenes]